MIVEANKQIIDRRSLLRLSASGLIALSSIDRALAASSEVIVGKNGWLFPAFDQVGRADFTRLREGASLIDEVVEMLKKAGIQTVICLTPAKSRIYVADLPDGVKFSAEAKRRYAFELAELRRPGTAVPDLAAAMESLHKAQPGAQLFFKGDTHWTPQGAECAARAIADAVKRQGLLPPSKTPGVRLGSPRDAMQTKNDLANLLPPDMKSKFPLEAYKLPQAAEDTGGDLLKDDAADVVLVGNSYLHPSFGFSVMLSNFLDRQVLLVWKIHSFSPFWNLLDYLGSPAFKAQRPKLLVWVFHETDLTIPPNNSAIWGQTAMKHDAIIDDLRKRLAG